MHVELSLCFKYLIYKSDTEDFRVGECILDLKKIMFVVGWGSVGFSVYFYKILVTTDPWDMYYFKSVYLEIIIVPNLK